MAEHWYAVRTTPSAQRMARPLVLLPHVNETEEDKAKRERRRCETLIERNLRNAGIDVFMPAFRKEIRRHRSRKLTERRYPFLVGYCFIRHDPSKGFDVVREIEGVSGMLCMNSDVGPRPFSEKDIEVLVFAEHEREQMFKRSKMWSLENARHNRRLDLTSDLGRLLPKGRSRAVSLRYHADKVISTLEGKLKARVLGLIKELDGLDDDRTLDEHRVPVYSV